VEAIASVLAVTGGLLLSLSCAVLLEELFIGGLCRLFFAPRPGNGPKSSSERKN
jgi:hypothetical protein